MFIEKIENDTCHRASEVLYFALFGLYGLCRVIFPYLESGKVATF
jgi:hypothetical protein